MIRPTSSNPTSSTPSAPPSARPGASLQPSNAPPAAAPANTRDAILDAAGVLLGRYGYHKTTMDDLATQAGIARRTLYLHFRCKDDIFLARIDRVIERLLHEERKTADGPGDARERLAKLLTLRVVYRLDAVKDYAKSLDEIFAALRGPYLERRACWFAAEATILERVLEEARRGGLLAFEDAPVTAQALLAATNSLIPYSLSTKEMGSRKEIERTLATLVAMLIGGMRVETAKKKR